MVTNPRTCLVNFRLTNEEHAQVKLAAKAAGARSLSEYARRAVIGLADAGDRRIAELEARVAKLEEGR